MANNEEKNKKPIYKEIWFWILIIIAVIVVIVVAGGNGNTNISTSTNNTEERNMDSRWAMEINDKFSKKYSRKKSIF